MDGNRINLTLCKLYLLIASLFLSSVPLLHLFYDFLFNLKSAEHQTARGIQLFLAKSFSFMLLQPFV